MKRSSALLLAESVILVAVGLASLLLPPAPFDIRDLLWFVAGLVVLKLFDVWLPRGDAISMSSALALGALLLFDARVLFGVLLGTEALALIFRRRGLKWQTGVATLAAEGVAMVVCSATLLPLRLHPSMGALAGGASLRADQYLHVLLVGALFAILDYGLLQAETAVRDARPIAASILGSLSYGGWLIAAQVSAGVLAALMYRTMSAWGLLVSIVIILVMRQSFVLLLDIRQAYDATIGVLVKAMEEQRPGREGLASRNADLCMSVGRSLGMHGRDLERVRYAALLLGVGSQDAGELDARAQDSSRIIEGVEFLSDIAPILRVCDDPRNTGGVSRGDLLCSYLVLSVASGTDTVEGERMVRLRERVSPRIVREVDHAVAQSIRARVDGSAETVSESEDM